MVFGRDRIKFILQNKGFEIKQVYSKKSVLLQVEDIAIHDLLVQVFLGMVIAVNVLVICKNMGRSQCAWH